MNPNDSPESPPPPEPTAISIRDAWHWIRRHWEPDSRYLPVLLGLTIANASIVIAYPLFLKYVIDGITELSAWTDLVPSILGLLATGLLQFFVYNAMQGLRARMNLRFQFGVRMRGFEHLLSASPSALLGFRTGDVVTRLTDDVNEKLAWFLCSGIFRVIEAAAIIIWGVAAMLWLNPRLTLLTAGPLPILVAVFVVSSTALHRRYHAVQQSISQLNDQLESCFSGIRTVKAFAAEPFQRQLVRSAIEQQRQAELRSVRWQTVIDSLYGNIWQLAVVGVLLAGGTMAARGEVSIGEIVAFEAYILLLVWPMFDIGQFLVSSKRSRVSIQRLNELEQTRDAAGHQLPLPRSRRPEDPDFQWKPAGLADRNRLDDPSNGAADQYEESADQGPIAGFQLVDVGFTYPGQVSPAIQEISITIKRGETVGLVGEIGSGKSTFMRLLTGTLMPNAGMILIDGLPLQRHDPDLLARSLGWAPQSPRLLSTSLEDNVRLGRDQISTERIMQCLEMVDLRRDVDSWPQGLATRLGTRGRQLSGGQMQRVSLARAIAAEPRLLLLDDCTSNLDSETETHVWQRLAPLFDESTVIVSTHRTDVLSRCDRIIVLEQGRVVEQGHFRDLDRGGTRFHDLYRHWQREELAGLE